MNRKIEFIRKWKLGGREKVDVRQISYCFPGIYYQPSE